MKSNKKLRYINEIFEKKEDGNFTQDALLYHDILRYCLTINKSLFENNPFRLRELQNWIVRNNLAIINLAIMKYSYSNRIHAKEGRINAKFENLVQFKLIHDTGTQKGKKVKVDVSLYAYTKIGILLTLIIKSMDLEKMVTLEKDTETVIAKTKELDKNTQDIYDLIDSILATKENSISSHIFYSAFFRKCKEKGVFHKLVKHVLNLTSSISIGFSSLEPSEYVTLFVYVILPVTGFLSANVLSSIFFFSLLPADKYQRYQSVRRI